MNHTVKRALSIGSGALMSFGLVVAAVAPASAGSLEAWDLTAFSGTKLAGTDVANSTIEVTDNMVSSAKNYLAFTYRAMNYHWYGSDVLVTFSSGTQLSNFGSVSNMTDYFARVG